MKTIPTTGLDQSEMATLVAQIQLHSANLRGLLASTEGESLAPPTLTKRDDVSNIERLTAHVNELEHRLGAGCPQFFAAGLKLGGATHPAASSGFKVTAPFSPGAKISKPSSLTLQILQARGAASLNELNKKPPYSHPLDK